MSDAFSTFSDSPISPSRRGVTVTGDDNNNLSFVTKEIQATGAGNISVIMVDSPAAITIPFAAGEVRAIRVIRIRATGTTATGILAFG